MTDELLDAHRVGQVEVAIGRASDYFGPGATRSALGETVFGEGAGGQGGSGHRRHPTIPTATPTPLTWPPH